MGTRENGTLRNAERSDCITTPERGNEGKVTIPLDSRLKSGIYFLRVNIDNNLLYYNKINIVR